MSEAHWVERAQTAEAQLLTQKEALGGAIERIKMFKANLGIREKQDGSIEIDFDKFALNIGIKSALELKKVINETYRITDKI